MELDKLFIELVLPYIDREAKEITDETKIAEELGLDSLDYVDLIMELEERLNINFDDADITEFVTVGDLKARVKEKMSQVKEENC